jgi:hypothetical protein
MRKETSVGEELRKEAGDSTTRVQEGQAMKSEKEREQGHGSPRCCAKATKPAVSGLASSGSSGATDERWSPTTVTPPRLESSGAGWKCVINNGRKASAEGSSLCRKSGFTKFAG